MPELTSHDVARWLGETASGEDAIAKGIVADSRLVRPGLAFAAIRGGHAFVADAVAAGAPFVIVERPPEAARGVPTFVVDDVVAALGVVASRVRERLDPSVIGVTGSVGKTLTKDLIAAALSVAMRVHATPGSYNAEIGVPLTILGCDEGAEALVVELGARRPGEIAALCDIARPKVGVVTGIGITHIELFGARETIARTKSELLRALPADGLAVIPSDDDFHGLLAGSTDARVLSFGPGAPVRYGAERIDPRGRTHGWVRIGGERVGVTLPVAGRPLMRNAAIAIAVAADHGVDPHEAGRALSAATLSGDRMEIVRLDRFTVVNDTYNANPTSVASALRAVAEMACGTETWAVLGEMTELGEVSGRAHERIGRLAAALGYAGVIAVGEGARPVADGAGTVAVPVGSAAEALEVLRQGAGKGAFVLMKASRSVGLEELVERSKALDASGRVGG